MAKYFKILLLFIFVTAPALDIALLDSQAAASQFSVTYQDDIDQGDPAVSEQDCICHVLHQGVFASKVTSTTINIMNFKAFRLASVAVLGLNPKPGLRPPSLSFS